MADTLCSIEDCTTHVLARGWCRKHYTAWQRHGDPIWQAPPPRTGQPCLVDDCGRPSVKRGYCSSHHWRWRKYGDPLAGDLAQGEARAYFESTVMTDQTGCLVWPYCTDAHGYGKLYYDGRMQFVHHLACRRWHGDPPSPKMQAAHGPCHNPTCYNGAHVSWKTPAENAADRWRDDTHHSGARANGAKLTDAKVLEIRHRLTDGEGRQQLADEFGVTYMVISKIHRGISWRHLLPPSPEVVQ